MHETSSKWFGKLILASEISYLKKKQMKKIFFSVFPMFSKKVLIFGLFWTKNRGGVLENVTPETKENRYRTPNCLEKKLHGGGMITPDSGNSSFFQFLK